MTKLCQKGRTLHQIINAIRQLQPSPNDLDREAIVNKIYLDKIEKQIPDIEEIILHPDYLPRIIKNSENVFRNLRILEDKFCKIDSEQSQNSLLIEMLEIIEALLYTSLVCEDFIRIIKRIRSINARTSAGQQHKKRRKAKDEVHKQYEQRFIEILKEHPQYSKKQIINQLMDEYQIVLTESAMGRFYNSFKLRELKEIAKSA
ncbi:helix-turn-helix domain-containing protein [Gallibacterium salpingitidis]|uniref:Uncharacterized protein n=1 Tax=Gallibacterium salpingitidis TaxID=505341 RepID=A0A1A7P033_9PAST|nr:helix-turn-helix domain-containing protein [Gallibacterium salpingitidis]OBW95200.1 hypothetical protein QS62_04225 [Gallibacterium salpingitidis]